jgi:hypothetical protein
MARIHSFTTATFIACSAAFFGCGDSDGPVDNTPSNLEYNEVAKSFGAVIAADGQGRGEISAMHDASDLAVGIVPLDLVISASGEINGNRVGIDYSFTVECKDVNGADMDVCNDDTDTANVSLDYSGELAIPPTIMASVDRTGSWSLTNIQSETTTLNGDSHFEFDTTLMSDEGTGEFHFAYNGDYENVTIERSPHRVTGGTIRFDISADKRISGTDGGNAASAFDIDAVLTFHADGTATFTLDGTHTYDLDLATGEVTVRVNAG